MKFTKGKLIWAIFDYQRSGSAPRTPPPPYHTRLSTPPPPAAPTLLGGSCSALAGPSQSPCLAEMQLPIERDDGLRLELLTPDRAGPAWECQAEAFADEPVTAALQPKRSVRKEEWGAFAGLYREECAANALSLVCVDPAEGGAIAGVFWVRDYMAPVPEMESVLARLPAVAVLIKMLVHLDQRYNGTRPKLLPGDAVDLWMLAVAPAYRARGIARCLTAAALQHAHARGFPLCLLEATGAFSGRCAAAAGMQPAVHVDYGDVEDEQIAALRGSAHTRLQIWEHAADRMGSAGQG